ncbi:MAG TPA: M20/M25/M40 family metallo-hydrolase, partial [Armatimonadota bacterium]|nr:M20/M25/M40 family metallo-hydrolase [Armatimonadota bacterium]
AGHLGRAVQSQTISNESADPIDSGSYARVQAFVSLHKALQDMYPRVYRGLNIEMLNNFSLLYTWQGADTSLQPVLLLAHMDVVPAEPGSEGDWTHPSFSGQVADGYVWGRGAIDFKNGVIGILEAVEWLLRNGFQPRRTVMIAFGHDEELGGFNGAKKTAQLLQKRGLTFQSVLDEGGFILEGVVPGVEQPVALVGLSEKGYLSLELRVEVEGGHSAMPAAQTTIGILGRAIAALESRSAPAHLDQALTTFRHLGGELPLGMRLVFANSWLTGGLIQRILSASPRTNALLRMTTAPTIIRAGVKDNILPRQARAIVNCRPMPGETLEDVIRHVQAAINDPRVKVSPMRLEPAPQPVRTPEKVGLRMGRPSEPPQSEGTDASSDPVRINGWDPSPVSRDDSPEYALLERTIRQVFPEALVAPFLMIAATDSRHFTSLSANIFRFVPMRIDSEDLARMHGVDERIALDSCARMVKFYIQWIRNSSG